MARTVTRSITPRPLEGLDESPAVALLGPLPAGKATLALEVGASRPSLYLDLESQSDRSKLEDAELFLGAYLDNKVERGFHSACEDLRTARQFVVHPGTDRWPLGSDVEAIGLAELCAEARRQAWA